MGLHEWRGGEGPVWGSRILRKEQGAGARGGEDGSLHPPHPPQPAGRTCRWSSVWGWVGGRKFPPDVPLLRVKWEAGSCRGGRGKQRRRRGFGPGRGAAGLARVKMPGSQAGLTPDPSLQPSSAGNHHQNENPTTPASWGGAYCAPGTNHFMSCNPQGKDTIVFFL